MAHVKKLWQMRPASQKNINFRLAWETEKELQFKEEHEEEKSLQM